MFNDEELINNDCKSNGMSMECLTCGDINKCHNRTKTSETEIDYDMDGEEVDCEECNSVQFVLYNEKYPHCSVCGSEIDEVEEYNLNINHVHNNRWSGDRMTHIKKMVYDEYNYGNFAIKYKKIVLLTTLISGLIILVIIFTNI